MKAKNAMKKSRINNVKNWSLITWLNDTTKSNAFINFCVKTIFIIVLWIGLLIPTWIYLGIRMLINPVTVMQELVLLAIMIIPIGGIQLIMAFFGFILTVSVIIDDTI